MSREDTINDLKPLMRELENKKREIDSQYSAVAVTIELLNGDPSESVTTTTAQQPLVGPDTAAHEGDEEDSVVPW